MTSDHLGRLERGGNYLPGSDYGFGLGVAVRTVAGSEGRLGEYFWGGIAGTFQWIDPERDLSAILMVQAPNQRNELRALFYREVYRALEASEDNERAA
jgi:CubicO group peptidase (beta-lactamase class C family)